MIFILVFPLSETQAQEYVAFIYDASGNRITRRIEIEQLKSETIDSIGEGTRHIDEKFSDKKPEEIIEDLGINIFPNPTEGKMKVQITNLPPEKTSVIKIYDDNGKTMKIIMHPSEENNIDLSQYPPGMYIMIISIGNNTSRWKIVKN